MIYATRPHSLYKNASYAKKMAIFSIVGVGMVIGMTAFLIWYLNLVHPI